MEIAMDRVDVRWMVRRDMAEVLDIERASFEFQWTEEDFVTCLRQRNCIGMVAECKGRIVGFMIYMLLKSQLHLINFAVAPPFRKAGVGRQMIERLVDKLSQQRRQEICLEVRETNLAAQLFFRANGFAASGVLRGHYEDTDEDAYTMTYRLEPAEDSGSLPPVHKNRITPFLEVSGEN
jgi:ribosomal-protein-alanine N-acetyltransferase